MQQGLQQQSVRDETGTELTYNGDWLALFDALSIPEGTINGRLLAYINAELGTSHEGLPGAMADFADQRGSAGNWAWMGSFTAHVP
jgi:hypothetical protein